MTRVRVRVVVLALGLIAALVPAVTAHAAPEPGDWRVAATLALGTDDTAISCATTTRCWALEAGQLLESNDGGQSWISKNASVPADVVAFHDIACGNAYACFATATNASGHTVVVALTPSHATVTYVGDESPWIAITCPGPRHCLATDGVSVFTTHDGDHWDPHALPQILYGGTADLTCVRGTQTCWAVGNRGETAIILHTTNDGATWHAQTAPASADGMYAVSCPSTTTCYAGGATYSFDAMVLVTTDGGNHWDFAPVPFAPYAVWSISCASTTACSVIGQGGGRSAFVFATTDGAQWHSQSLPVTTTLKPVEVSCPSPAQCAAIAGGVGFTTLNAGAEWAAVAVPAGIEAPQSLSCPSSTQCVAVGNNALGAPQALTSPDGGTTWTAHALPDGTGVMLAVECPSTTVCVALATAPEPGTNHSIAQALRSQDGGVTWKAARVRTAGGVLRDLACPSPSTCLAVGYDNHSGPKVSVTTDGGRRWQAVAAPPGIFYTEGVACSTAHACVVIAQEPGDAPLAFTTPDLGTTYEPRPFPYVDGENLYFSDAVCAGKVCVAVGEDAGVGVIMRSTNTGTTWRKATVPHAAMSIGNVSCASATTCGATSYDYAPGGGPLVLQSTNAGKTWTASLVPARNEQPIAIACHLAGCIASDVGPAGNPVILAGGF